MKLAPILVPPIVEYTIRGLGRTWRVVRKWQNAEDPRRTNSHCCYAIWHRTIIINAFLFRDLDAIIPSSLHEDGELGSRSANRLGFRTPRGSSTRGGSKVLRELLRIGRKNENHIALTSDGPKGPAEISKLGVLFIAGGLGRPLVPSGAWAKPAKILRTWDQLIVPSPFAKVASVSGEPLEVPRRSSDTELERLRVELDRRILMAQNEAREIVHG